MATSAARFRPRVLLAVVLVAAGTLLGACADDRATGDAVRGLVILSGDVGATRLTVHGTADGSAREVDVPAPTTAWISGGPGGLLVATLADGRVASRSLAAGGDWRFVSSAGSDAEALTLLFGVASPDGKRVAALTLSSAGRFGVAIAELESGTTKVIPIDGEPMLTSPAWIDDARVGIVAADAADGGVLTIADVDSGVVTGGPAGARGLAVSADGAVVSWLSATDGRLYATNSRAWLVGELSGALPIEAPSGTVAGAFGLDADGGRLAVVWERDDGRVERIGVYRRTGDGWIAGERLDAPGGDPRAVVSWLQ
jgi:hypothetical protein